MAWLAATGVAVLVGACGASGRNGAPIMAVADRTHRVAASCAGLTPGQLYKAAHLVFEGTMLPGAVVTEGATRVLVSPARVRVIRYLKGSGPRVARVQTAVKAVRNGVVVNSEGIEPRAGQRWQIYTDSSRQPFATSICSGSRLLPSAHPRDGAIRSGSAAWRR